MSAFGGEAVVLVGSKLNKKTRREPTGEYLGFRLMPKIAADWDKVS